MQHVLVDRDPGFLPALADHPPPPAAAHLDKTAHGVFGDLADPGAKEVEQGDQEPGAGVMLPVALAVAGQGVHRRQQG
ncbi:hypothetical protein RZS08_45510, partial [Arthrospira platensis SPKY1]|nr:hypothetical protein [Arthrospira platensis SPKY1]